jgi:hypothetical protein
MVNIFKLMQEISRRKLLDNHISFSPDTKPEAAEMLTIFESIGLITGFEFLVGLCLGASNH